MINAHFLLEDGTTRQTDSIDDIKSITANGFNVTWIDMESPEESDMNALAAIFSLDPEAVEDCLRGEQRPRIDEFESQAFLMLYGALGPDNKLEFSPRKLAVFIGAKHIITVHKEPLRTIDSLLTRADKYSERVLSQGADYLLFIVIDSMVDNYLLVANDYDSQLDTFEEKSLLSDTDPEILSEILALRKQMLELRRLATSLREMLQPITLGELKYISDKLEVQFVHVRDHLTTVVENIDNSRELLHGVRDNYHAALANQTNETMQMLTVFASLFLPLSLIAGVYGMNTILWPSVESPYSFWYIIGGMVVIVLVMLSLFKRKGWF